MSDEKEVLPEELVTLTRVLGEDGPLLDWFLRLENLSDNLRFLEISKLTARMKAEGDDPTLVTAIAFLRDSQIYRSVRLTLRDCYHK